MLLAFLKINMVLALLSLVYWLGLRKLTFYQLNRWYFLLTIVFSFAYPFIDLSFLFNPQQQKAISQFTPVAPHINSNDSLSGLQLLIAALLLAGSAIMLFRLIRQLVSLYIVHRRSVSGQLHNTAVQLMPERVNPFSFGRFIYINPALHSPQEQEAILAHEKIHVKQWHTIDILLAEFMLLINWFNPAAWFMGRAIRENLEFITDNAILQKGFDRKQYQYSLLQVSVATSSIRIANEFTLKDIKRRIQMMNGRRSSRFQLLRYSVFPLFLILFILLAVSAKEPSASLPTTGSKAEQRSQPVNTVNNKPSNSAPNEIVVVGRRTLPRDAVPNKPLNKASLSPAQKQTPASVQAADNNQDTRVVTGYPTVPKQATSQPATESGTQNEEPVIVVTGYAKPKQ